MGRGSAVDRNGRARSMPNVKNKAVFRGARFLPEKPKGKDRSYAIIEHEDNEVAMNERLDQEWLGNPRETYRRKDIRSHAFCEVIHYNVPES